MPEVHERFQAVRVLPSDSWLSHEQNIDRLEPGEVLEVRYGPSENRWFDDAGLELDVTYDRALRKWVYFRKV